MILQAYVLHALSPLHVGVGQAAELIDLPIARLKGSGIPFVPGSSIKGVLRDDCEGRVKQSLVTRAKLEAVFGPGHQEAGKHAGALICADARLLALPVRSFRGTFAYVTSPLLLTLAKRDLFKTPDPSAPGVPSLAPNTCMAGDKLVHESHQSGQNSQTRRMVYLEDLDLTAQKPDTAFNAWSELLLTRLGLADVLAQRLAVVDDETMTFLWETATQLDQRVRIDPDTRTVARTALWLEESLPSETLMLGLLAAEQSHWKETPLTEAEVLETALPGNDEQVLQFGGKSTVGRGRCRMVRL